MIFNINKKFTNKKLEYMFSELRAENYSMYDTYFENKCGMKSEHMFKEHYHKFKPSLDEIEKFDTSKLNKVSEMQEFIKSDLSNLFSRPYNKESRNEFLTKFQENFDKIPELVEYRKTLSTIEFNPRNLTQASEYFHDPNNFNFIKDAFASSRIYCNNIMAHPDITLIVDIIAHKIENCTNEQLQNLIYVVTNYEQLTLVTFEPYLVVAIGNTLFFKVFVPLHRSGAFILFMKQVINKQYEFRANFIGRLTLASDWLTKVTKAIQPGIQSIYSVLPNRLVNSSLLGSVGVIISNYIYNYIYKNKTPLLTNEAYHEKSTLMSNAADKLLEEAQNLESPTVGKIAHNFKKVGFVIGRVGNSITEGVVLGISSKNEETIKEVAKKADQLIDKSEKGFK